METSVDVEKSLWHVDTAHSSIEFSVSHMVISEVTGHFRSFKGIVTTESDDFVTAKIELTIEAASIDTNNESRDNHLRSSEFLDVIKHPQITFKSAFITRLSGTGYSITGDFTVRGVTKRIILNARHNGTVIDPAGNTRAGFKVTGELNRKDFGVNWHKTLDSGGLVAGDILTVTANMEIVHS